METTSEEKNVGIMVASSTYTHACGWSKYIHLDLTEAAMTKPVASAQMIVINRAQPLAEYDADGGPVRGCVGPRQATRRVMV